MLRHACTVVLPFSSLSRKTSERIYKRREAFSPSLCLSRSSHLPPLSHFLLLSSFLSLRLSSTFRPFPLRYRSISSSRFSSFAPVSVLPINVVVVSNIRHTVRRNDEMNEKKKKKKKKRRTKALYYIRENENRRRVRISKPGEGKTSVRFSFKTIRMLRENLLTRIKKNT